MDDLNIFKFELGGGLIDEKRGCISFAYDFHYRVYHRDAIFKGVLHLDYSEGDSIEDLQDYARSTILDYFWELVNDEYFAEGEDMIKKSGSKYKVMDSSGKKVLGTHETKAKAEKQLAAIEISKKKKK